MESLFETQQKKKLEMQLFWSEDRKQEVKIRETQQGNQQKKMVNSPILE